MPFESIKNIEEGEKVRYERKRIRRIGEIIELAKERQKLKEEVIALSNQDPRFLEVLKETLDSAGL